MSNYKYVNSKEYADLQSELTQLAGLEERVKALETALRGILGVNDRDWCDQVIKMQKLARVALSPPADDGAGAGDACGDAGRSGEEVT